MPVSAGMKDYLKGTAVICSLVKVVANDGTTLAICNHTRNLIFEAETYLAWPFQPTQFQQMQGLTPDNAEVSTVMAEPFSDIKLRGRKWSGARVTYQLVNPVDTSLGPMLKKIGFIGDLTVRRFDVTSQFRSLGQKLSQSIGEMVMEDCIVVELGDAMCGVDLDGDTVDGWPITTNATVTAVSNQQQITVNIGTPRPDDFYARGSAIWTAGNNLDIEMHILKNTGNAITLFVPAYFLMQIGDTVTLIAGCDRKRGTCRDKFANAKRFKGYPDLPGRSKILKFPE